MAAIARLRELTTSPWLNRLRRGFIPLALLFIAYSAYRASDYLLPLLRTVSVPRLLLACMLWGLAQWIGPLASLAMARILGIRLGYRELALISVLRLPAKYLPGGIWQSVARFAAYQRLAIKNSDSMTILVVEHVFALGTSIALGSALLLLATHSVNTTRIAAGLLALAIIGLLLASAWLRYKQLHARGALPWILNLALSTCLFWMLAAASFCVYWIAVFGYDAADLRLVGSSYLLSWAAGFVVIFSPQGLGVFEWVAGHLMPSTHPLSVVVIAVAGFRMIAIIGDLSAWSLGLALSRCWSRGSEPCP
ncbi:hypothetical protein [Thermomonas sp.]|uniref:hypothetical protein n=2 Tax=Thermomonas sp. TaxID=1971895 RepID=UPI0026042EC2|nr:hypothetical protein [Thermomonas sp.]MBL0228055.1 hypothetical protein [Thermomonas sp.]